VRFRRRGRQVIRPALLALALLTGACASSESKRPQFLDEPPKKAAAAPSSTGSCRPWFVDSPLWSNEEPAKHSCWNLLWEVPTAMVAVPVALGFLSAPIWVPLVLL
jgi:hypothetical protein